MKFMAHRINTLAGLADVPHMYGVEVDLRDSGDRLIMAHDPFSQGEDFEPYAAAYRHGTLILNVKSERIEHRILEILQRYSISDYFLLDSSFPMIHLLANAEEHRTAIRFSEYEGLDTAFAMQGRASWIWVDCFTRMPLTADDARRLRAAGYKLCLVSPELQGRPEEIEVYASSLRAMGTPVDAICTKLHNIPRWQNAL